MTERGLPIADAAPACPFVAFDDARDDRSDRPDPRHRCYAESPPAPRARAHQEAYCLAANFPVCPTFQDWARRESARVIPSPAAGSPAERLRDVPAQRVAGSRPPAYAPPPGATAATLGAATGATAGSTAGAMAGAVPAAELAGLAARGGAAQDLGAPSSDADIESDGLADGEADEAGAAYAQPWDIPPRRPVQGEWSAPPPWAGPGPGTQAGTAGVGAGAGMIGGDADDDWVAGAPDEEDAADLRLKAVGMSAAAGGVLTATGADRLRPPTSPNAPAGAPGASAGAASAASTRLRPDRDRDAAAAAIDEYGRPPTGGDSAEPGSRSSSLARLVGWDRRPRAGAARPARRTVADPSWERPKRYEAYPTLKTRVGIPMPSRLLLAGGAILVAALILFFVPPLILRQGGGAAPGATRTPAATGAGSSGGSGAPSAAPTAKPAPTPLTYTVKQGDTLSTIAKRFKVTVEEILAVNKQIKNPNKIAIGDVIVIPTPAATTIVDGGASASP